MLCIFNFVEFTIDSGIPRTERIFKIHVKCIKELFELRQLAEDHAGRRWEHDQDNKPENEKHTKVDNHHLNDLEQWSKLLSDSQPKKQLNPAVASQNGQHVFNRVLALVFRPQNVRYEHLVWIHFVCYVLVFFVFTIAIIIKKLDVKNKRCNEENHLIEKVNIKIWWLSLGLPEEEPFHKCVDRE